MENETNSSEASQDNRGPDPFGVYDGEEGFAGEGPFEGDGSPMSSVSMNGDDTIRRLESDLKEARERELRSQAELENFRKRTMRDVEQQIRFANFPFARDLLEVVDNLNRATSSAESVDPNDPLLLGMKLVQQQLMQVFEKYHCKPIDALGQLFDPNYHQALAQAPSPEYEANRVMVEASKGYLMHDRVIRPSQVIVSTGTSSN